jgi:hypothetical protein
VPEPVQRFTLFITQDLYLLKGFSMLVPFDLDEPDGKMIGISLPVFGINTCGDSIEDAHSMLLDAIETIVPGGNLEIVDSKWVRFGTIDVLLTLASTNLRSSSMGSLSPILLKASEKIPHTTGRISLEAIDSVLVEDGGDFELAFVKR